MESRHKSLGLPKHLLWPYFGTGGFATSLVLAGLLLFVLCLDLEVRVPET